MLPARPLPLSIAITDASFRAGSAWLVDYMRLYVAPALAGLAAEHALHPELAYPVLPASRLWEYLYAGEHTVSVPVQILDPMPSPFAQTLCLDPPAARGVTLPVRMLAGMADRLDLHKSDVAGFIDKYQMSKKDDAIY